MNNAHITGLSNAELEAILIREARISPKPNACPCGEPCVKDYCQVCAREELIKRLKRCK